MFADPKKYRPDLAPVVSPLHMPFCDMKSDDKTFANFITSLFSIDKNGVIHDALGASLSDKIRPEVSDKIREILMSPNRPVGQSTLPDDDMAELLPDSFEDVETYQSRVFSYLDAHKPQEPNTE